MAIKRGAFLSEKKQTHRDQNTQKTVEQYRNTESRNCIQKTEIAFFFPCSRHHHHHLPPSPPPCSYHHHHSPFNSSNSTHSKSKPENRRIKNQKTKKKTEG